MLSPRHLPSWHFLLILGRAVAVSEQQTCYLPNGLPAKGNFPCFLDQDESPCCGADTICEASGLCRIAGSIGVSDLIRGSCTDQTWNSPECPQYCLTTDAMDGGINLISCQNVTSSDLDFCCDHVAGCCDSAIGRFQVPSNTDVVTIGSSGATVSTSAPSTASSSPGRSTAATTSSSSSALSSSAASSTTISSGTTASIPSPSASSTTNTAPTAAFSNGSVTNGSATSKKSTGLSTGALVGIAVASVIAAIALIGGLVYYFLRKRGTGGSPGMGNGPAQVEKPDYAASSLFNPAPQQAHPAEIMTNWEHRQAELQA